MKDVNRARKTTGYEGAVFYSLESDAEVGYLSGELAGLCRPCIGALDGLSLVNMY